MSIPIATNKNIGMAKQLSLIKSTWTKDKFAFGASLLKGSHPKTKRPFNSRAALHVVMRSGKAVGKQSLLRHDRAIAQTVDRQAKTRFVTVYAVANAGNHLHLLVKAPSRAHLANFLRGLTGRVAQIAGGSHGFWDARPFSRIVSWGQDFKNVARYITMNSTEMVGITRSNVKAMFEHIRKALQEGRIPKNPNLIAAGFA